ncbi:MAG TPA: hypothetical protein VE442_14320 [Jatrophihabitans sp.]|nr:hypothetical protein [Jatrophihabitans sp.]
MTRFGLSSTQLLASALAAVTAAIAASYLGVAGTVIGAALASVVSAVGTAVYGHSLHRTRARVRTAVTGRPADQAFLPEARSAADSASRTQENVIDTGRRRGRWPAIAMGTVAVFAIALAVVTGIELAVGRPVSAVVRGDAGSGTSFFGGSKHAGGGDPAPAAPTVTQTVTPSVVVTTPTITRTAPAVTKTATPTVTDTQSSTPTPSTTSATPTAATAALG